MDTTLRLTSHLAALAGLQEVEALVGEKVRSEAPRITEIASYLKELGGKRMRPALTLLVAKACNLSAKSEISSSRSLIEVAAGIELIHMATLLHDDIIDHSPIRRHQPSPFARYGGNDTLLVGDFLLVRAFGLCAHLDDFIIDATELACMHLTEGEILETSLVTQEHSLASSLEIARKKTASLFRLGARSAAYLAGMNAESVEKISLFGEKLGIAFQMLDDVLDVTSTEQVLGKRPGTDIRERKPSLVNMLWLLSGDPMAQRLTESPGNDEDVFVRNALEALKESAVIEEARHHASSVAQEARTLLIEGVGPVQSDDQQEGLEGLLTLIEFTLERVR